MHPSTNVQLGRAPNRPSKPLLGVTFVLAAAGLLACGPGTFEESGGARSRTPGSVDRPRTAAPPPPAGVPTAPVPPGVGSTAPSLPPLPIPPPPSGGGGQVTPPGSSAAPVPAPAPTPPGATPLPAPAPAPAPAPEPPPSNEPPRPKVALLIVGNGNDLVAGDLALALTLEEEGYLVLPIDDADMPDEMDDAGVAIISPTVAPQTVAAKYRNAIMPTVVMEFAVFDEMRMTAPGDQMNLGSTAGREVAISAAQQSHPLAAGLTGTVEIAEANGALNWGVPAAGAIVVATLVNAEQRAAIFGYPQGAMMQGQAAPGKRVGFFASEMLTGRLNDDGLKLFAAAVNWAWTR